MPEAQPNFDANLIHRRQSIAHLNSTYERIDAAEARDTNWSSSSNTDVSYVSLVNPHPEEAADYPTNGPTSNQDTRTSAEVSQFCCCSSEARRNLSSCWKSKRRQIIRESAHASAKNRTTASTTTAICQRRATKATLTQSLLPRRTFSLNTTTTTTTITTPDTLRKSLNAARKFNAIVSNGPEVVNASISLPATPNLSLLQRRQYKKLSLPGEAEYVASVGRQQQQQQQLEQPDLHKLQSTQQRQQTVAGAHWRQMSTTATVSSSEGNTLSKATTTTLPIATATADHLNKIHQQPSMLHAHELIANHASNAAVATAATATTATATTATATKKIPAACNAHFVAKNNIKNSSSSSSSNNNNSNNNTFFNNNNGHDQSEKNNGSLSGLPNGNSNKPTPTHTPRALLSSNGSSKNSSTNTANAKAATTAKTITTTTTTTTSTTTITPITSTKSSLAFCEHCCESASVMSGNSCASSGNSDRNAEAVRLFGADVDSVFEELSSFRLISEEEESDNSAFCHATTRPTQEPIPPKNNNNGVNVEPVTHHRPATKTTTTTTSATSICCYTIEQRAASLHHSASNAIQNLRPSAPLSITSVPCDGADEAFRSRADSGCLSNSLPNNYLSAAGIGSAVARTQAAHYHSYCVAPQHSSVRGKLALPPTPPPKPQRDSPGASSNANRQRPAVSRARYDPASFRRRLQKFEKQTASSLSLSPTNTATRLCNEEPAECSSPEPCELLNCFGTAKNTRERERAVVARSSSDSSCGDATVAPSPSASASSRSECVSHSVGDSDQKHNNVATSSDAAWLGALEKPVEINNNYNCKIIAYNQLASRRHFGSSPLLNRRTLRYDSCGRLKADGGTAYQQPTITAAAVVQKSLSASRLLLRNSGVAGGASGGGVDAGGKAAKFTPTLCRKLNFEGAAAACVVLSYSEDLTSLQRLPPLTPHAAALPPTSPKSPKAQSQSRSKTARNQSENDLSGYVAPLSREKQLFKSFSETHNLALNETIEAVTSQQQQQQQQQQHNQQQQQQQQQQRSYSDHLLKSSTYFNGSADICQCASTPPTPATAAAGLVLQQHSSASLPSVPQSNGSQSPLWLSSETIASSRGELKFLDDAHSNCSDQTTVYHLEHDYSTSSSPLSSQSCVGVVGGVVLRGPLLLRRIPEIQSFGNLQPLLATTNAQRDQAEFSMEKRRNTLDRFQRLGFGRKSSSSPAAEGNTTKHRKSAEKSEKLKELTELLRGNRSSPTATPPPPPVPPPRKPRIGSFSSSNSLEKADKVPVPSAANTSIASASDSMLLSLVSAQSDDILLMDAEETSPTTGEQAKQPNVNTSSNVSNTSAPPSAPACECPNVPTLGHTNAKPSRTDIDLLKSSSAGREDPKSPPPSAEADSKSAVVVSTDIDTKLTRPESRTVIGSYTQKGIPFRSASFSQIDYSSGKYKKSALSLLRDRLRRDKAVDRAPSPTVRNAEQSEGHELAAPVVPETVNKEPDWIYIPLKSSEVNASTDGKVLEDVAESADAIIEEDVGDSEKESVSVAASVSPSQHKPLELSEASDKVTPAPQMESPSENDYTIDEEQLPVTVKSNNLPAAGEQERKEHPAGGDPAESSNLATLMEEELPLESPPDNFLQTATTCLIPVPVYECAAQDWRLENPPAEWVEVASEEFGIVPETMQPLVAMDQCSVAQSEAIADAEHRADVIPTISVRRSSEEGEEEEEGDNELPESELLRQKSRDFDNLSNQPRTLERRQASLDYPEVKKRYSHDDMELGTEKRSSLDSIATRFSAEERKRLDKSRRRKGMYIESTDWGVGGAVTGANRGLALDITIANLNALKDDSPEAGPSLVYLNSPATDENRTPGSLYSLDLNTPDSECGKPPVWTKSQRLLSFSCQSSEEKDEAHSTGSGHSGGPTTMSGPLLRQNKSYPFYLHTDSISDNESDRTPPPSRDRTSASPALSETDFKRYSKRPLRGPYGQMLEAEMKKPNKMHFEEILEELRESEGPSSQPSRRQCAAAAYEQDRSRAELVNAPAMAGGRHLPQYSNSVRVRKTNTYLPVPLHARAASTPSQIENINHGSNSNNNNSNSNSDAIVNNSFNTEQINPLTLSPLPMQQPQTSTQSPPQSQTHHHLREMKRAASEAPATKPHHSKRSQSMSGEKPTHHQHQHQHQQQQQHRHHHSYQQQQQQQQKRSLDVSSSTNVAGAVKQKNATNLMPTPELLAELLKGSSEKLLSEQRQQVQADTRTHVVQEIFKNEQSYVESLQTVVLKYLKALKSPEHAGMIDSRTVDEIFFMVPDILDIHEKFLAELRARLDNWNTQQKVGDAFMETFSKLEVLEVYTSFVNNCNRAKNAIRSTKHQRPSFSKFLETTAREHKGKLTLDNLLIKPVQKFPNYEMLFTRLIKHTDHDHPDQKHLQDVLKLVHDILVHINCKEREILENGQREAVLRELEGVIEGVADLIAPERQFLLFDLVAMPSGQGARKERGFFLFNDLLVLTSIKKRSGTIRKPNTSTCPGTVASTLDTNKYKFLTKVSLDCLEIVKTKDENLKRIMSEIENLAEDCNKLQQITDLTASLKYPHQYLEDVVRELHRDVQRQLSERQTNDAQLNMLELAVSSPNGSQKLSIVFSKAEKRSQWEKVFNEAKQKLAATLERHPIPEFLTSIPIRKTRAGLQFTCAAATLSERRDVWVCNSDGYVGQVCIMSLHPEPNVTSCNGVCNARILCVASVPAYSGSSSSSPDPRRTSRHQSRGDCRKSSSPSGPSHVTAAAPPPLEDLRRRQVSNLTIVDSGAVNNNNNNNTTTSINNNNADTQLDLNSSSSDDDADASAAAAAASALIGGQASGSGMSGEYRVPSPAPSIHTTASTSTASTASTALVGLHQQQDSNPEESDGNQSTMWIGTEDGCIHVYNSTDNIRIKKNRIKIEHHSAVYSILYLDNRVFVSLANGDICVYLRDGVGWHTSASHCIAMGTVSSPVSKLLNVHGKLWCSIQGIIKVLDVETLLVVNQIQISSDSKPITNMTVCHSFVWISIQNSAHIKCFHSSSHHLITEVNLAPAVNKMLSNCDEIIRQHKAACLRVTSLLSCKDLIWIGTSAGVLLTIPAQGYEKGVQNVVPTGIPHGHTGHVRFLTYVETSRRQIECSTLSTAGTTVAKDGDYQTTATTTTTTTTELKSANKATKTKSEESNNILIISGGDGYEDFRNSGANSLSEIAGREDSTNHLLIWRI